MLAALSSNMAPMARLTMARDKLAPSNSHDIDAGMITTPADQR